MGHEYAYTCCAWAQVNAADKEEQEPQSRVQACIFKVGDDCRQDVLALQVVRILLSLTLLPRVLVNGLSLQQTNLFDTLDPSPATVPSTFRACIQHSDLAWPSWPSQVLN